MSRFDTYCRSCRRPIVWAVSTKTGKRAPIDRDPTPGGNVRLTTMGVSEPRYELTGPLPGDEDRHTNHFATCPDAQDWRNNKQHGTKGDTRYGNTPDE